MIDEPAQVSLSAGIYYLEGFKQGFICILES
jgi:hypothetical protein